MAVGDPAQRAPTTIASYMGVLQKSHVSSDAAAIDRRVRRRCLQERFGSDSINASRSQRGRAFWVFVDGAIAEGAAACGRYFRETSQPVGFRVRRSVCWSAK